MQALTGNKNLVGHEAILKGFKLNLQRLDQVPDVRTIAPKSPREILRESWPDDHEFFAASRDEKDEVAVTVWELNDEERELFRDFELIDLGWYKDGKGKAVTLDGKELDVEVAVLGDEQEVSREVDGINYDPWFNCAPEKSVQVAEKARREFFERVGQTPEGKVMSETVSRS